MTQKTYTMDERDRVLRLIPTEAPEFIVNTEKGYKEKPVKSFRQYDDGLIEITFKEEKPKRPATIRNDKTIGKTTIKFSKERVNLLTSFAKKEVDEAMQELHDNLPLLQAYVKSQVAA